MTVASLSLQSVPVAENPATTTDEQLVVGAAPTPSKSPSVKYGCGALTVTSASLQSVLLSENPAVMTDEHFVVGVEDPMPSKSPSTKYG